MTSAAKILIVEDESIIALDLRQILTAQGYLVVGSVASGEEAVETAETLRPDLVLMDIRLNGAMTGLQAAQVIRQRCAIPSLFVTSFVDSDLLRQAKECAALGYVLKPFNERDLAVTVEMALHRAVYERDLQQALQGAEAAPASDQLQIQALGTLSIFCGGKSLEHSQLSRSQRQLLALILSSPQQQVSREEVELALWPDSTPERARSSFDSLLLRLRRNLNEVLQGREKDSLLFRHGILALENCQIDVCDFRQHVRQGIEAFKRGELAVAEAQHSLALECWQGDFMPGVAGGERTEAFRLELREQLHHCCRQLGTLLCRSGRTEEGIAVLRKALAADPSNDLLVGELYRLLIACKNVAQARQLLKQYSDSLRQDGFSAIEIAEALQEISGGTEVEA